MTERGRHQDQNNNGRVRCESDGGRRRAPYHSQSTRHAPYQSQSTHGHASHSQSTYGHDPYGSQSTYGYGPSGYQSTYGHDPSGSHATYGHDPYGSQSTFGYDPNGYQSRHGHSPSGSHATYGYAPLPQSTGYGSYSRGYAGTGTSAWRQDETNVSSGITRGYGAKRDRGGRSNCRDENGTSFSSSSFNGGNGATSRRHRPIERNGNRSAEARDVSIDDSENHRDENGTPSSSNGATSHRPSLDGRNNDRSRSSSGPSAQRFERESQNRRERDLSKDSASVEQGLVPVIKPISQTRPASKQGTSGVLVNLVANYFRVTKTTSWQLYLYRVDFLPVVENRKFQSGMLHEQMKQYGHYIFDGTMMFVLAKLEKDVTEFVTKGKKDDETYRIQIKLVGLVPRNTRQYLQFWALLLRKCENTLGLQLMGRNYYDPNQKRDLPLHKLQLWHGFVTAIHQHERDVLVCVDVSTKVLRTDTVYDIWRRCNRNKDTFENKVLGMTVLTTYTNKTYRISGIGFDQCPLDEFPLKAGEQISFMDYFKRKHDQFIKDPHQPMLIIRSSERQIRGGQSKFFALVPELCLATGFDDDMRKNHALMRDVAQFTRCNPRERILRSQALIKRLQDNAKSREIFKDCNFQLDANPIQIKGRQLMGESVTFGKGKQFQTTNWSRQFHSSEMYSTQSLKNWVLIYPRAVKAQTQQFVRTLQEVATGMKYIIETPFEQQLLADDGTAYINEVEKARNRNPQLVVCVLTCQSESIYGRIKKYCIENAMTSQILVRNTITPNGRRDVRSIATKVAIQLNSKLGGVPWIIKIQHIGVLIIGFDVYHNTKDKRKKSCGAMVATWDVEREQKYYSTVSAHISGNELSNDLSLNVSQAVRTYYGEKDALPQSILFYRDGVGEGDITYVKETEISSILDGLSKLYGDDTKIPLTFVVVTKRVNTRFFVNNRGNLQNPQPGTVVDDEITMPEKHDFLLVSPSVGQGTVSPTNFNMLLNHMELSSDELQRLTYQLTYLYYNWSGTISVPAVCHYARKLSFLVGNYGLTPPSNDLQNRLYFL